MHVAWAAVDSDAAADAADEAVRLLLDAGCGVTGDDLSRLLAVTGAVARLCSHGQWLPAAGSSSSEKPSPWCGMVSTTIKLARRVTRRLRRSLQAAPSSRRQRPDELTGGTRRRAGGAAAVGEAGLMPLLAELLQLVGGATGALHSAAAAVCVSVPAAAPRAVSPAELHLGASCCPQTQRHLAWHTTL